MSKAKLREKGLKLGKELLVEMYRRMLEIRLFEERVVQLHYEGLIGSWVLSSIGQEAVAVGACIALREDDLIQSNHRALGHILAKGGRMDKIMAELFCKESGYNSGKGGAMHIIDMEKGILGANGIVGAGIVMSGGAGLAAKMRGAGQVVVCFFGDGAANEGAFHEGLNLAAVWKVPVIFVCENNLYASAISLNEHSSVENLAERAVGYGIPGITVDGNDVLQVYTAVLPAVQRARKGDGPSLIECKTYRWRGSTETERFRYRGDRAYRTEAEIQSWTERCPIKRLEAHLLEKEILTEEMARRMAEEIKKEVEKSVIFAKESKDPPIEYAYSDVFA